MTAILTAATVWTVAAFALAPLVGRLLARSSVREVAS